MQKTKWTEAINLTVIVAGLGYFVDMFDLTLFGVVRVSSLKALGITDLDAGIYIYNMQMVGMMIGGLMWGVLADKKGRISVMFGSILLYSVGNIANAFAWDLHSYAIIRLLTGIGLAGELGAAITIVAESLPKDLRGIGTTIVATLGLSGAVAAALVSKYINWQAAYILGGVMGLSLLVTRMKMKESLMFKHAEDAHIKRGSVTMLFTKDRFWRYLRCILVGIPIYFVTGILFTFSPEIAKGLGVEGDFFAADAMLYGTIGLTIGDLTSGLLSQILKGRKKSVLINLLGALIFVMIYLLTTAPSAITIYLVCFLVGICVGYWAVLITMAAEQFGTNIRGLVATTIPNFVRGAGVLITLTFSFLKDHMSIPHAALTGGFIWFGLALIALYGMKETFSADLDYYET